MTIIKWTHDTKCLMSQQTAHIIKRLLWKYTCSSPVCIEEQNYLQFYSYSSSTRRLMGFNTGMAVSHFLCEEPEYFHYYDL